MGRSTIRLALLAIGLFALSACSGQGPSLTNAESYGGGEVLDQFIAGLRLATVETAQDILNAGPNDSTLCSCHTPHQACAALNALDHDGQESCRDFVYGKAQVLIDLLKRPTPVPILFVSDTLEVADVGNTRVEVTAMTQSDPGSTIYIHKTDKMESDLLGLGAIVLHEFGHQLGEPLLDSLSAIGFLFPRGMRARLNAFGNAIVIRAYEKGILQKYTDLPALRPETKGIEAWVQALYRSALGREAADSEVAYWSDRYASGWSRIDTVNAVAGSEEALGYEVNQIYRAYLARSLSVTEIGWQLAWLADGNKDTQALRLQVAESAEFHSQSDGTQGGYVRLLFRRYLNRDAADPEVQAWTSRNLTDSQIAEGVVASPERVTLFLKSLYARLLARPMSDPELSAQLATFLTFGELGTMRGILASDEYFLRSLSAP